MKAQDIQAFFGIPALIQLAQPLIFASPSGEVVQVDGSEYGVLGPATVEEGGRLALKQPAIFVSGTLYEVEGGEESCLLSLFVGQREYKVLLPTTQLAFVTILPDPKVTKTDKPLVSLS